MSNRPTAVVIAPGRGTYNASELGYLQRFHIDKSSFLDAIDAFRRNRKLDSIRTLDGADRYSLARHGRGSNAAGLIYACALGDYQDIGEFDVVAITGNSMGWYLALAAAGALQVDGTGIELTETMAGLMDAHGEGGQLVYPLVDEYWHVDPRHEAAVRQVLENVPGLSVSIRLGGSVVLAGSTDAIRAAERSLPRVDERFPLRLANHAAFHTSLLESVSRMAFDALPPDRFTRPGIPLIDGRGHLWQPWSDPAALRDYTLGHQVTRTYDFTRAIEVALKEFAPDRLILLGPGTTLGAPVLQTLTNLRWLDIDSKERWLERQAEDPFLLSMGIAAQRTHATRVA